MKAFLATWLILPVVICLFQRLSHACPSFVAFYEYRAKLIKAAVFTLHVHVYMAIFGNAKVNACPHPIFSDRTYLLVQCSILAVHVNLMIHSKSTYRDKYCSDNAIEFLTYQLETVGYLPTVAMTGSGGLRFASGEGAR